MSASFPTGSTEKCNVASTILAGLFCAGAIFGQALGQVYMVNGRQYIALTVGNGGAQATTFPPLVPEIRNPPNRGAAIRVFELEN